MRNVFITIIGVILVGLSSFLSRFWSGMSYFALVFTIALMVFWIVVIIINYKHEFYENFQEKFDIYVAHLINYSALTLKDIEDNLNVYLKKFKKTLLVDKIKRIMIMAVMFVIVIICFSIMLSGKL